MPTVRQWVGVAGVVSIGLGALLWSRYGVPKAHRGGESSGSLGTVDGGIDGVATRSTSKEPDGETESSEGETGLENPRKSKGAEQSTGGEIAQAAHEVPRIDEEESEAGVVSGHTRRTMTNGAVLEVSVGVGPIDTTEPRPITVRIINDGATPVEVSDDDGRWESGVLAIEVIYEDGWRCRNQGVMGDRLGPAPRVKLAPGEKREITIDMRLLVECPWAGSYWVRVGRDPQGTGGRSPRTEWARPVGVVVMPPSTMAVEAIVAKCADDLSWQKYRSADLRMLSTFGGWAVAPKFQLLRERMDREAREGVKVPDKVAAEIRFGEERIRIMECVRECKWADVEAYLKEPNRGLPLRRELQEFLRKAFATRLSKGK